MRENAKVKLIPAHKKETHLIDAGIYVRVSTARAPQLRSLSSQVSAMTRYVYSRENWILKDVYLEVGSAKTGASRSHAFIVRIQMNNRKSSMLNSFRATPMSDFA